MRRFTLYLDDIWNTVNQRAITLHKQIHVTLLCSYAYFQNLNLVPSARHFLWRHTYIRPLFHKKNKNSNHKQIVPYILRMYWIQYPTSTYTARRIIQPNKCWTTAAHVLRKHYFLWCTNCRKICGLACSRKYNM